MAKIYGGTTTTPMNPNMFGGGESVPTSAIRMWQPNTEYKVGDYCLWQYYTNSGDDKTAVNITYLMYCKEKHTSTSSLPSHQQCWIAQSNVECATKDGLGRYIVGTYATKEELVGTLGTINEVLATLVEVEQNEITL